MLNLTFSSTHLAEAPDEGAPSFPVSPGHVAASGRLVYEEVSLLRDLFAPSSDGHPLLWNEL